MRWFLFIAVVLIGSLVGATYLAQDETGWTYRHAPWLRGMAAPVLSYLEPAHSTNQGGDAGPYITAVVQKGDIRETVTANGTLNAVTTVDVGSQLSGQIARLFVDFNDAVKQNQPLAQLDRRSYQARVAEAQAAVEMAQAEVETKKARLQRAKINLLDAEAQTAVLQARTDSAKIQLRSKQTAVRRKEKLVKGGTISPAELEDVQDQRDAAAAALREAEAIQAANAHKIAGARVDVQQARADLGNAEANLPQKRAQLRLAAIDLERTTIRSPITGIVVGRNVSEGQTVAASLKSPTLFTIAGDLRDMQIAAHVDEADIGKIAVGQKAGFTVDAFPGKRFPASVREIRKAPQVEQNVVSYTVILSTSNARDLLLPGMTALVRIVTHETGPVLEVPLAALRFSPSDASAKRTAGPEPSPKGRQATVWMLGANGRPKPIGIAVGPDDGSQVAVVSGPLKEGQEVIVNEVPTTTSTRLFGIRFGF